jgi:hypothetical protein
MTDTFTGSVQSTQPTTGSEAAPASQGTPGTGAAAGTTTTPPQPTTPTAPAGTPAYGTTETTAAKLNPLSRSLATRSFQNAVSTVQQQELRATLKDHDVPGHLKADLKLLKSLQDGSFKGGDSAEVQTLLDTFQHTTTSTDTATVTWMQDGMKGSPPPAALRGLQKIAAAQVRGRYRQMGVDPGSASNYKTLSAIQDSPVYKNAATEAAAAPGQTQPLQPFSRANGLLTMLRDVEGKGMAATFNNVDPAVKNAVMARLNVSPVEGGTGTIGDWRYNSGNLQDPSGTVTPPARVIESAISGMVRSSLQNLGMDPGDRYTYQQLVGTPLTSRLSHSMMVDGYNLDSATTFGSLLGVVNNQSRKTAQGLATPGGVFTLPGTAGYTTTQTGAQYMANFKDQWQKSAAFRSETAAALSNSGVSGTSGLGDSVADYNAAANAMMQVLQQTPANEAPQTYLDKLVGVANPPNVLHANLGYAVAQTLAGKVGAHLSDDQLNRLAQIFGDSTTTGNQDAEMQAISSMYRFDPNSDPPPDSYAASMLQNVQDEYGKYGIPLTEAQAGKMVQTMLNQGGADLTSIYSAGDAATAAAEVQAKKAATAMFPTLAPLINEGNTLTGNEGILQPYASAYAQLMGTNPDTVIGGQVPMTEFIQKIAQGPTGAAGSAVSGTGAQGAAQASGGLKSIDDFTAGVMQDPTSGYASSPNAHAAMYNMADNLLSTMGFVPPTGSAAPQQTPQYNVAGGQV